MDDWRDLGKNFPRFLWQQGVTILPANPSIKQPVLESWKEFQSRKPHKIELLDWKAKYWSKGAGYCALCGPISDNLIVLDFDSELLWAEFQRRIDDLNLLIDIYSFPVIKTHRGYHLYLKLKQGAKTGKFLWGEIRGNGALAMCPPSQHPEGEGYWWINYDCLGIPRLDSLSELGLEIAPPKKEISQHDNTPGWVTALLSHGASEGQRNAEGIRLAGYYREKGLSADAIRPIIQVYAAKCSPPLPNSEIESILKSISQYSPGNSNPIWKNPIYAGEVLNGV